MSAFGVETAESGNTFFVSSSEYKRSAGFEVEGDFSNAAFLECFNYLGGDVKVDGLPDFSVSAQGDKVYRQMFASLAAGEREFRLPRSRSGDVRNGGGVGRREFQRHFAAEIKRKRPLVVYGA